jgi:uncharacterized protein YdbL (DUF1318 family)
MRNKLWLGIVFLTAACVTVNIYFPAPAVQKAADQIVGETWGEEKGPRPDQTPKEGSPKSENPVWPMVFTFLPRPATAQEPDINVSTPAIRALKESIKNRSQTLKQYMDRGNVGITADGLLTARNTKDLSLRERAEVEKLVDAENRDREALYQEIAEANKFPKDRVKDIKRIFANSWIDQARPGWWIQDSQGNWRQK